MQSYAFILNVDTKPRDYYQTLTILVGAFDLLRYLFQSVSAANTDCICRKYRLYLLQIHVVYAANTKANDETWQKRSLQPTHQWAQRLAPSRYASSTQPQNRLRKRKHIFFAFFLGTSTDLLYICST